MNKENTVTFSQATPDDLEEFFKLSLILNEEDVEVNHEALKETNRKAINDGIAWVAKDGDKIIGICYSILIGPGHRYFPNSVFIAELYVMEEYRRKGIGEKLMRMALAKEYPKEYPYFSLTHDANKPEKTKYYEKFGFKKVGVTDVNNIVMHSNK